MPLAMLLALVCDRTDMVVIHGLYSTSTLAALLIYGMKRKKTLLVSRGIGGEERFILKIRSWLIRLLIKAFGVTLITQSSHDSALLAARGISKSRIHVIPGWLSEYDLEALSVARSTASRSCTPFMVLYLGRLDEGKEVGVLVEAFAKLAREVSPVALRIVGPPRSDILQLANKYLVQEKTEIVGWVSDRTQVYRHYIESDVLVLPTKFEGFGRVSFEARYAGVPVIASDIPQLRQYIDSGVDGYLFSNVDQLVCELKELVLKPSLRERMILNGYERVQRIQQVALNRVNKVIDELIGDVRGPHSSGE